VGTVKGCLTLNPCTNDHTVLFGIQIGALLPPPFAFSRMERKNESFKQSYFPSVRSHQRVLNDI
jgi:hypothetical protein